MSSLSFSDYPEELAAYTGTLAEFTPQNQSYWLAQLCASNYQKLWQLMPNLNSLEGEACAHAPGKPSLYLQLLEKSAHTLTLKLTHSFRQDDTAIAIPAVRIRLYLDARAAEVLDDHARPDVFATFSHQGKPREVLEYKWNLNYFLSRWLDYCLQHAYAVNRDLSANDQE